MAPTKAGFFRPWLLLLLCCAGLITTELGGTVHAVPTVPKPGDLSRPSKGGEPQPDKRWFKKWRGERPGLEQGEKSFHAPRPVDFDVQKAFKSLPVTEKMLARWDQEEDQPVASFAYTVALALGGVAALPERTTPGFSSKVTVHAIGAAKYREARIEDTFGTLCQVLKLNPELSGITEIDVVLVGPTLSLGPTKDAAPVVVEAAGCRTTVSIFSGGYSAAVLKEFPAPPDVVVGFDVDAYTCSWRKSLLYIIENQLPAVLSFMMPHEPLWVEELLAEPSEAFGKPSIAECTEDLRRQRKALAKQEEKAAKQEEKAARKSKEGKMDRMTQAEKRHTIAQDELAVLLDQGSADDLLDWTPVGSAYDLSQRLDVFLAPFDEAPMVGNNPFGGKMVTRGVRDLSPLPKSGADSEAVGEETEHEHDKDARAIFGHPNSYLLGFLAVGEMASDTETVPADKQKKAEALLHAAKVRMKEENRPIVSRWTAMDTNRAIRKKLPGWTANRSVKSALSHYAAKNAAKAKGLDEQEIRKGAKGLFGALKDGIFGSSVEEKVKKAQQHAEEKFIEEKATLTEVTGLLPKKHADFDLFKKQMLPKLALQGGAKADATESKLNPKLRQ